MLGIATMQYNFESFPPGRSIYPRRIGPSLADLDLEDLKVKNTQLERQPRTQAISTRISHSLQSFHEQIDKYDHVSDLTKTITFCS